MLRATPLTLKQANGFIALHHRHHKPVRGHRFSIGAVAGGEMVGVCVVGRPVARKCDQYATAEITRLASDGSRNVCSFLYAAAARAATAMGFEKIQTYILESEPGTSLRAAGFAPEAVTDGGKWVRADGSPRRDDQPDCPKVRYARVLNAPLSCQ